MKFQINRLFVVRWPDKNSGALFLSVLFFVSFFWTSKRKKIHQDQARDIYTKEKIAWACTNPTTFFNASGLFLFVSRQKE